jgi:hypothetical protein
MELQEGGKENSMIVCKGRGRGGRGEGEWRSLRWRNVVDGFHINMWSRVMKPLAIAWSETGGKQGGKSGSNLTNVQYEVFAIVTINSPIQWINPN